MRAILAALSLGVSLLAVPAPAQAAPPDDLPQCSKVWKVGKRLPQGYDGCRLPNGGTYADESLKCNNGLLLRTYRDRLWALGHRKIKIHGYDEAFDRCTSGRQ